MLEAEKIGLDGTIGKLGERVDRNKNEFDKTRDDARKVANKNASLEDEIRKYEHLIKVLDDEDDERVRQGKRSLRNVNPRDNEDGTGDVSMELLMA